MVRLEIEMKNNANNQSTVSVVMAARRAGLDMREVGSRLDRASRSPVELRKWSHWVHGEIRERQHGVVAQLA